ncbi:hypothetical protein EV643_101363 [Kribbella sp. VKM Ac-2527]|uniref:Lipoprotein LprG n=1 Tax=Kribbella caucasensis TaxID=2512215 RepID=A0A4R6KR00_9ACTN|nr:hypothetical protein [Kribbella sp. VKM Ac-2527]TDO54574.1 hypothetical protein EV643_101363 [Kribbella sp. VKM Ac-2527]
MRLRTRAAAVLVALPLALGLVACGSEPAEQSSGHLPSTPVQTKAAPQKAAAPAAAKLTKATFVPAMNAALGKQRTWRTVAKMTVNGRLLMTITGFQQAEPLALSMEMTGEAFQGSKAKIIVVDGFAYLSMPGSTPAGKFVKVDASAAEVGALAGNGDPTKTFKAFGKSLRGLKFVRSETIGGQKLDRYELTVDTAAVLRAQGKPVPDGVPKTLKFNVWMDSAKLVRRMTFNLAGVNMVMTMADYNKPVIIKAPPASKIVTR